MKNFEYFVNLVFTDANDDYETWMVLRDMADKGLVTEMMAKFKEAAHQWKDQNLREQLTQIANQTMPLLHTLQELYSAQENNEETLS